MQTFISLNYFSNVNYLNNNMQIIAPSFEQLAESNYSLASKLLHKTFIES